MSKSKEMFLNNKWDEEKQAMLAAIVDSSDDAIISKNLNGIIISWNRAAQKMFGFTEREAIGNHISIIIPPDRLNEETMIIENIRNGKKIDHLETVRMTKNGAEIEISLTISPIRNSSGEIIGASKIARDITARKRFEVEQAMLAAIVRSSDDAIISKNLDGIITSWNYSAQKMFGFTESEAIGKHISIIIPGNRLEEETLIIDSVRNGRGIEHFETIRRAKDGTEINISLTVSPIKNSKGEIIGASKIARDITDKIELQRQHQLFTERLRELNKYKDEFMVMASHELKTPLTVISANLQLLELKMKSDPNFVFVNKTINQVKKLSNLIGNLLDVSKIQSGKLDLNASVFDVSHLLKEIIGNMQMITSSHSIHFNNTENLIAYADMEKIGQVITNLLGNAIKYSPDSKEIIVEAFLDKDKIKVSFRDYGIGIPQQDLKNIFTRFFRVSGLPGSFSGSGVGLYISSEIIRRHNGEIWAESKLGEGSVFYFGIPAEQIDKSQN